MPTAIGARSDVNNPGDLTVTGPSSFLYPGQSGVYSSSNGHYFATFPDAKTGYDALLGYIHDNVGSDPETSLTNLQEFAGYYLNGNPDSLAPTASNPNPSSWLMKLQDATGLGRNDPITPDKFAALAHGVMQAEGTATAPIDDATAAVKTQINKVTDWFAWIGGLFSANTAMRLSAAVIGVILVALAIWAFLSNGGPQLAVNLTAGAIKNVGKTAVSAA